MYNRFDYSVTILIPTYNRKKFEKLIEHNINCQTYYNIQEIIILDDSDKDEPLCIHTNYPIRYIRIPRVSIGLKRTYGCSLVNSNYIAFMDTDDFYKPNYISTCIFNLLQYSKTITGSADMIMMDNDCYYKQCCMFLHMLNEATMVFKKEIGIQFNNTNSNEAVPFLIQNISNIVETDIDDIMCCISHDENTIDKKMWCKDNFKHKDISVEYEKHLEILSNINL